MQRLEADLRRWPRREASAAGLRRRGRRPTARAAALVEALTDAAGADASPTRSTAPTGPAGRGGDGLAVHPLARRSCGPTLPAGCGCRRHPVGAVRTSLPGPSAVQRARVDTALRELTDRAAGGLPDPWPGVVRGPRRARRRSCPTCSTVLLPAPTWVLPAGRRWWRAVGFLQACSPSSPWRPGLAGGAVRPGLAAVAGRRRCRTWAGAAADAAAHRRGAGWATAGVARRALARAGGRRAGARARGAVQERVERVADEAVVAPVESELAAHVSLCAAVRRLHV